MIRISKQAIEKLKGSKQSSQRSLYRIFISGMG
jgi:hypothetical protein